MVDAVHAHSQLVSQDEARKQLAVSDVLLLTKTDLAAPAVQREVEAAIKAINGGAELFPVLHGEIDPELLFGRSAKAGRERDLARWLGADRAGESAGSHESTHSMHAGDIRTFTLEYEGQVSASGVATWLSMLASFKGPQLLRVKGIVNVSGSPYVIHVVQTVVHEPVPLERWPTSDERTRIVFIVRELERATLEKSFAAFSLADSLGDTYRIDPAAYIRFS